MATNPMGGGSGEDDDVIDATSDEGMAQLQDMGIPVKVK